MTSEGTAGLRRHADLALAATLLLVAVGGFTRGSGSGFGCRDRWPLCEGGVLGGLLPRWEFEMVVEWSHRWLAAVVVALLVALWWRARRHHAPRRVTVPAGLAVVAVVVQALIGAAVVRSGLHVDLVSLHFVVATILLGVVAVTAVTLRHPSAPITTHPWQRQVAAGALGVFVASLFGSLVHDRYVPGWPLVQGQLVPEFTDRTVALHFTHRTAVVVVLLWLGWLAARVVRGRPRSEVALVHTALACYLTNIGLGAAHVFTRVSEPALIVAHLGLAAAAWAALVAATARATVGSAPTFAAPPLTTAGEVGP